MPQGNLAPAWRSVHGLGVALQVLLWISLAASLLMMAALANERAKADDVIGGNVFALEDLNDAIDTADAVNALGGMLAIAVFVLLIIYCWRGAKNIETLGRMNPTLGSGWAIGAWFIPLASAILVPLVFAGVWKGSDPTVPPGVRDWKRAPLSALLPLWWVAWILGSSLLGLGEALYTNEAGEYETIADLRSANTLSMIGTVVIAGAVVFSVLFVSKLTQRLDIWGEHLGYESRSGGPTGP